MPFGLGPGELLLILAVLLLVFGAKRLPELGGALGKGIREFKNSVRDIEGEFKSEVGGDHRPADRPASRPAVSPPPPANTEPAAPTPQHQPTDVNRDAR